MSIKSSINDAICSLPLGIKVGVCSLMTFLNSEKKKAIELVDVSKDPIFKEINTPQFKKNLKKHLSTFNNDAKTTRGFVEHLYNDRVVLERRGNWDKNKPFILCVVKNEADKLVHFFDHYNNLGEFNYIFIDNGSTDESVNLMIQNNATIYKCEEQFTTQRKLCWINKVYASIPNNSWVILLDADELLVYHGYEKRNISDVFAAFEEKKINTAGAIMIDMFSTSPSSKEAYFENYLYFHNSFHEEKSFFFNSVYGGIREREFNTEGNRIFLLKKHPVTRKTSDCMLISCHYVYPYRRNFQSKIYFGLLHYKLFDSEIEKYKKIAEQGSYGKGGGSKEYKSYVNTVLTKSYEEIFAIDDTTIKYNGTESLRAIECVKTVEELL